MNKVHPQNKVLKVGTPFLFNSMGQSKLTQASVTKVIEKTRDDNKNYYEYAYYTSESCNGFTTSSEGVIDECMITFIN
jgi:hypothetical protein